MAKRTRVIVALLSLISVFPVATLASDAISFNRDIRPILSDRCFHCHGPDSQNQDSEFRLDTHEHATADLGGYFGIVPGDLDASELHVRIRSTGDDQMPPAEAVRHLTPAERDILDTWIESGAPFDSHWSFRPVPEVTAVPAGDSDWVQSDIDRFVYSELSKNDLAPNHDAPREKWLRRVTFDLTGLPPTIEEIDDFLADTSPEARERAVDRLLASDACAERLAAEWLDVARYSDTYGYQRDDERFVWPYRDWVIRAFAENMPYDQFVTWQLAGDLMDSPSRDQLVATVFNRLHSHKKEGGVALEEFRIENVADRTHTFAAAFMGLTLECSRCHDHKYDPVKMRDYYQLSSFFANVDERGLISYFTDAVPTPAAPWPSEKQADALAEASQNVTAAERALAAASASVPERFARWRTMLQDKPKSLGDANPELAGLVAHLDFESFVDLPKELMVQETGKDAAAGTLTGLTNHVSGAGPAVAGSANRLVSGKDGQGMHLTGDDSVFLPGIGHFGRDQPFSLALWIKPAEVTERAVIVRRSRGWDDAGSIGYELTKLQDRLSARLVHFWPGNAICIETTDPLKQDEWQHVVLTYDGSSKAAGLQIYINGAVANTTVVQDHLTRQITDWRAGYNDLAIGARYRDRGFKDGLVDSFYAFNREISALEAGYLSGDTSLSEFLSADARPDPQQLEQLREYYVSAIDETVREAREQLKAARRQWNVAMDATPAITIMREQATPRPAYMLTRGVYDQHGEEVTADTPAFLLPFPEDAPRNRLGLAEWITSSKHPLTARVTVNRYWQMIFGNGLVRTPEDFGAQGEIPTHPELLDWLARDFMNHGWDVRRLLRQLVLSSTYRQSAVVSTAARDKDPENRLLSRGPDQRLSAEMIRDNALAVSGLLNTKIGGPPVKPYDLALAYTPLEVDEGESLYRRSLYTFWKRTAPAPVMMTMNANRRDVCRLRREVTASPLQALVLLNGRQFVEAAQALATELLKKHGDDPDAITDEAFRLLTSRAPSDRESKILKQLFAEQKTAFEADTAKAASLLNLDSPHDQQGGNIARTAAATVMVNAIMNLDEAVRNR